MKVRANADTPKDAAQAFSFGAEGIGLCRTEHMFFEGDRIKAFREMILADDEAGRRVALAKLLPNPARRLRRPVQGHERLPRDRPPARPAPARVRAPRRERPERDGRAKWTCPSQKIVAKVESLAEFNPMLGHRGCRLGNTYPEITEMQARAIIEAAMNVRAAGHPRARRDHGSARGQPQGTALPERASSTRRPNRYSRSATTRSTTWSAR